MTLRQEALRAFLTFDGMDLAAAATTSGGTARESGESEALSNLLAKSATALSPPERTVSMMLPT